MVCANAVLSSCLGSRRAYFFLCLSFLKRFLRLCVDILCLLCFLPFGIILGFLVVSYLTAFMKVLAGLKAGILWAGMVMAMFLPMLRPVFSALVLMMKLPKPLR